MIVRKKNCVHNKNSLFKKSDITIVQERDIQQPPVDPLVIKQIPPKPSKPPILVIREKPPKKTESIPSQYLKIPGKVIPPPPRKVILEKFPKLPSVSKLFKI
jgi:hypothetical protein